MKTFLQLSIERKEHQANRVAVIKQLSDKETISVDFGIYDNTSTFEVEVWNKRGSATIGHITIDATDGIVSRRKSGLPSSVIRQIEIVLEKYPSEETFGVEALNWENDSGYIYPANGYGNLGIYRSREELQYMVVEA